MRRLAYLIAIFATGICGALAQEKPDQTIASAEGRQIVEAKLRNGGSGSSTSI